MRSPACIFAALLLATTACRSTYVPPPLAPPSAPATSALELEIVPGVAHAYVSDEAAGATLAVCSARCTLRVPAGRFRIAAGLRHAHLALDRHTLVVEPGRTVRLRVDVEPRFSRRRLVLFMYAAGIAMTAGGGVALADGLSDELQTGPVPLLLVGLGGALVVTAVVGRRVMDHSSVEVRETGRW